MPMLFYPEIAIEALNLLTTEELQNGLKSFEFEPSLNPKTCFCGMSAGTWENFSKIMRERSNRPDSYFLRCVCSSNYEHNQSEFRKLVLEVLNERLAAKEVPSVLEAVPAGL